MVELFSLRVGQGNNNPEVLGSALVLEQCAQFGRIFWEVEETDFDFAVETGGRDIDGVGDIGEAEGGIGGGGGGSLAVQAIGMAIFEGYHGGDDSAPDRLFAGSGKEKGEERWFVSLSRGCGIATGRIERVVDGGTIS